MKTVPYPKAAEGIPIPLPQPYTIESEARLVLWLAGQSKGGVLEIGCSHGFLTLALAIHVSPRTVYAVDWSHNPALSVHQDAERPVIVAHRALHLPNVIAIDGDAKRLDYPANVGFVFIDGDHTYEGVKADTEKALAAAVPFVCFHDFRPESGWQGVAPYLESLAASGVPLVRFADTPVVALMP